MYWIKDPDSDLIDLANPHCIMCKAGEVISKRWAGDGQAIELVLFRGSDAECGKFRDDLFRKLLEIQHNAYQPD